MGTNTAVATYIQGGDASTPLLFGGPPPQGFPGGGQNPFLELKIGKIGTQNGQIRIKMHQIC